MKKFVTVLAASALAMTMAATAFATEASAPGQQCAHLTSHGKRNCMRGAVMMKKQMKMDTSQRKFTKRAIKEMERGRQRTGGVNFRVLPSSSSSATSSSASSY